MRTLSKKRPGRKKGSIPWNKGKTKEDFPQLSNSGVKPGTPSWNKGNIGYFSGIRRTPIGFTHTEETKKKMSKAHLGDKAYQWKDEDANYFSKHNWIRKMFGKAVKCENELCNSNSTSFQWANISGKYIRKEKNDWCQLCASCHKKLDTFKYKTIINGVNICQEL